MASPNSNGHIDNIDYVAFGKAMLVQVMSGWEGLQISPRGATSQGARLCTCLQWFARLDNDNTEPYDELRLLATKLRSVVHSGGVSFLAN